MHQEKATLQRQLKPMHVWAVAFGCIVGWGSFINPGKKFLPNSGVAGTAIAMALGALVMIIIAFSYAYMVPKYPQAGGEFTFTKMCFGKRAAYVCGWFLVAAYLTNVPMNSTAIGLIVDGLDGSADILKFGFHYQIAGFDVWLGEMLLAMGILILFGLLNIWGVKKAGIVQSILAALLAASVFTLTAAALISSKANGINMHPIWALTRAPPSPPVPGPRTSPTSPTPVERVLHPPSSRPSPSRRGPSSALIPFLRPRRSSSSPIKRSAAS